MKFFSPALLVFGLAGCLPSAMAADDTYRSVMPDGSVRYGDSPAPGARSVKRIPPPPGATGTTLVTPEQTVRMRNTPVEKGGSVVIPLPDRAPPPAAQQGQFFAPADRLPQKQ